MKDTPKSAKERRKPFKGFTDEERAAMPRLWYGMPAYAKDGKVVCFFQSAQKFKTRYATLGFSDAANLDENALWPVAVALKKLTAAEEAEDRRAREESGELRTELAGEKRA